MRIYFLSLILSLIGITTKAQVGEHRDNLSIGINTGYIMSNVAFVPKVVQGLHSGITSGVSIRYVCEKYFNSICSIYGEINYASIGWKQTPLTYDKKPVININGKAESYQRTLNYLQIPIFAHLAWGKEINGFNFFIQAGPQIGVLIKEYTKKNYSIPNLNKDGKGRANTITAQEHMPVEQKFDYGIAAGMGIELSNKHIGHILLEARYYYGLNNIYHSTKRDFFGKSNIGNIAVKLSYLIDLTKTK